MENDKVDQPVAWSFRVEKKHTTNLSSRESDLTYHIFSKYISFEEPSRDKFQMDQ